MLHKRVIRSIAHAFGVLQVARQFRRSGVRILEYHRFPPDTAGLQRECEHIRRHYHPLALGELARCLREERPWPEHAVVVTIDDGYRDFLTSGHPVFRAFDIPATLFVVSDFADGRLWLWPDVVEYTIAHSPRSSFTFALEHGPGQTYALGTPAERRALSSALAIQLTEVDNECRLHALRELQDLLEVEIPQRPPEPHAPLTWNEIRALAAAGVEIGAHTKTHPILPRVADPAAVEAEIVLSKARIEEELGQPVRHFCFPSGQHTPAAVDAIRRAGYETAVTTERGMNAAGSPRFLLRRLGVEPSNPMEYFAELLSGVRTT
jgi:peptidoglycan/xylan/chitin deacetylase (PgdA/CDA1 family)